MATVMDVYCFIDKLSPFTTQMSFDNAGFLVGHGDRTLTRVLVSLDITREVAEEAASWGAQLIVSHHPVIFTPAKSITDQDATGRILLTLVEGGVAAICAHTNLDLAEGGVNDALAKAVGLRDLDILEPLGTSPAGTPYGLGRVGKVSGELSLVQYAAQVKEALGANGIRYVDAGRTVRRVAVGGGACAGQLPRVAALECDTFITSDVKYNGFLDAKSLGINLIDAGHYPTENVVCPVLARALREAFPGVEVLQTAVHREVFSYL